MGDMSTGGAYADGAIDEFAEALTRAVERELRERLSQNPSWSGSIGFVLEIRHGQISNRVRHQTEERTHVTPQQPQSRRFGKGGGR